MVSGPEDRGPSRYHNRLCSGKWALGMTLVAEILPWNPQPHQVSRAPLWSPATGTGSTFAHNLFVPYWWRHMGQAQGNVVRWQKFVLDESLRLQCSVPFPLGVSCWLTPSLCFRLDAGA